MERMTEFFEKRVEGYDEHMLTNVEGISQAYEKTAALVPAGCEKLLDLGCGTGLELEWVFKLNPDVDVTAVDLTQAMLDKLIAKFPGKSIKAVCKSYFDMDFGTDRYGCALSFQTMHHFSREAKTGLYRRIRESLKQSGIYIECDYMVESPEEEHRLHSENDRIRREKGIAEGEFYHFDIPFTVENQIGMLNDAGFGEVRKVFRTGNTTIITACK